MAADCQGATVCAAVLDTTGCEALLSFGLLGECVCVGGNELRQSGSLRKQANITIWLANTRPVQALTHAATKVNHLLHVATAGPALAKSQ